MRSEGADTIGSYMCSAVLSLHLCGAMSTKSKHERTTLRETQREESGRKVGISVDTEKGVLVNTLHYHPSKPAVLAAAARSATITRGRIKNEGEAEMRTKRDTIASEQ